MTNTQLQTNNKAVIYARDMRSAGKQERDCLAYARGHNLSVVATYADSLVSGTSGRPALNALLRELSKGQVQHVLVQSTMRLARDVRVSHALAYVITEYGVDLIVCDHTEGEKGDSRARNCSQDQD